MHSRSMRPGRNSNIPAHILGRAPALLDCMRERRAGRDERSTEAEGWRAIWRIDGHSIRIVALHSVSDVSVAVPFPPARPPDLADMREKFPELSVLWDAIRREYWRRFLPS